MSSSATEVQCPVSHSGRGGTSNRDWWPNSVAARPAAPALVQVRSDGQGLQLREGVQEPRLQGTEERSRDADDRLASLVAGGLRSLRSAVHPHGLAQRRHVSHRRWPRRRRPGAAALRAAQQLAGQRQPRQGASAALAHQAEVRPQDFLGRPDDPHRQRRARDDGLQDFRLRRRSRGRLGAGPRRVLGRGERRGSARRPSATTRRDAISRTRSRPCRWASSTSTPKARTAIRIRSPRRTTSAKRSRAWR